MSARRALRPRTWPGHLLALVCVGLAGWLGFWQFQAWQAERAAEALDLTRAEPVPISAVMGPDDPFPAADVGRPVELSGHWQPEGTVYISGREHQGREGYWVATPLAVGTPDDPVLMVVRGWTPEVDAAPAPPQGEAAFVARLQPAQGTGEMDRDPTDAVLPQLRVGDLVQHVDQDLYGAYAVLAPEAGDVPASNAGGGGLAPASLEQLPEVGGFTGLQNFLYGVEWWVFGAFAGFIWWRWLRDDLLAEPDVAPATVAEPATGHLVADR